MPKWPLLLPALLWCMLGVLPVCAALTVTRDGAGYIVENGWYRLGIDPARGGAIRSFRYKPFNPDKEWIYPAGGGLCEDMIWQQGHPGELQDFPYESRVLEQTPTQFRIELWRAFKQSPYTGLVMRKVITLRDDSAAIAVRMTLENPTDAPLFPGAWVQNRFFSGGNKGVQVAMRPSYLGIRMSYFENGRGTGDEFVRKPADGWAMTFDRELGVGFLALVDYNYLQMHYSCLSCYTTEFFYDRVLLQPKGSWSTDYLLAPVQHVHNCFYGDRHVFATASQQGRRVTFNFRATDAPVPSADVSVLVEKADRSAKLAEKTVALTDIGANVPRPVTVEIPGVETQPVIVHLTVRVGGETRGNEFMYARDEGFYHLQESANVYRAPLPKKVKPELLGERNLRLQPHAGLAVVHAMGLWHEMNHLPEMLRTLDPAVKITESFGQSSVLGPELTWQPLLAEDLLGYDLVILDNVGATALGEAGEIAVQQYVQAGGSLLVCGGMYTLGKARWPESPLAEVLPVVTAGPFDLRPYKGFQPIHADTGKGGLGTVQWVQQVKAVKPGARVRLTAAGQPLLVTGNYGKGKVAVWLGTPMGDPPATVTPYWESADWKTYMTTVLNALKPEAGK